MRQLFMLCILLAAVALGAQRSPAASEGVQIVLPGKGSTWTYRYVVGGRESVQTVRDVTEATIVLDIPDQCGQMVFTHTWGLIEGCTSSKSPITMSPPREILCGKLREGDFCKVNGRYSVTGGQSGQYSASTKVLGKEMVTVPAGTFEAVRILVRDENGNEVNLWYSPQVARYVKRTGSSRAQDYELLRYELVPGTLAKKE